MQIHDASGLKTEGPEFRTIRPSDLSPDTSREVSLDHASLDWKGRSTTQGNETLEFLNLVAVPIEKHLRHLRERVRDLDRCHPHVPFRYLRIERNLVESVERELLWMIGRVCTLELHVARIEERLSGATSRERYQSFVALLAEDEMRERLATEYPVLFQEVERCLGTWVDVTIEMLHRLTRDHEEIAATFNGGLSIGELTSVMPAGDPHRKGRRVSILEFSSGLHVAYKPRSVAIEHHFQDLLRWIEGSVSETTRRRCGLDGVPLFRPFRIIERGTHGWVEYVAADRCDSRREVELFYARLGCTLAILHALEATDFHYENLIAAGQFPVLVDLESLFHASTHTPALAADPSLTSLPALEDVENIAGIQIAESVLRVGLLPQRIFQVGDGAGVELSGLGGEPGQWTPRPIPRWKGAGTDEMALVRQRVLIPESANRPRLADPTEPSLDPLSFRNTIAKGFSAMYEHLSASRDALLSPSSPLAAFAECEVRVILRASRDYTLLLRESYHPDLLRKKGDRERYFEKLRGKAIGNPHLERAISSELAALSVGDIPLFRTTVSSRDVEGDGYDWARGSTGRLMLTGFLDESGFDRAKARIRSMSVRECERQLWFLHAAFTALVRTSPEQIEVPLLSRSKAEETISPTSEAALSAAISMGNRLADLAIETNKEATWIGLGYGSSGRHWDIAPLGVDLYGGLSGVALFLSQLADVTGAPRYLELSRKAFRTLIRQLDRMAEPSHGRGQSSPLPSPPPSSPCAIGAFAGLGGVVYVASHLLATKDTSDCFYDELTERLPKWIATLERSIHTDRQFDIVDGSAGAALSLLAAHKVLRDARSLDAASACGEHLLAHARPEASGVGWISSNTKRPMAGFAHGASGIATALFALAKATGNVEFERAGRSAFRFERSLFSNDECNWPDVSRLEPEETPRPGFTTAWCHGAPGIGLAHLRAIELIDGSLEETSDLENALATTESRGFGSNHSLCHGDLGNLELLARARIHRLRAAVRDEGALSAEHRAGQILASLANEGPLCGVPTRTETPGLMMGLSGIGHGLLRWARPSSVPSVLTLDAPLGSQQGQR